MNMLDVTEGNFEDLLDRLENLGDAELEGLSDSAAFDRLDRALYGDDDRSREQIVRDAHRFGRFNFLLHWGEMFDHPPVHAYLLRSGNGFRVLFRVGSGSVHGVDVSASGLRMAIHGFLDWMNESRHSGPR